MLEPIRSRPRSGALALTLAWLGAGLPASSQPLSLRNIRVREL
jgi:hypothetical protein